MDNMSLWDQPHPSCHHSDPLFSCENCAPSLPVVPPKVTATVHVNVDLTVGWLTTLIVVGILLGITASFTGNDLLSSTAGSIYFPAIVAAALKWVITKLIDS